MTGEGRAPVEVLKVSATSKPVAVAGAIAGVIRNHGRVEVQAIGAGAINQAIKAIAISRGYVAPGGIDIVCVPSFIDISIDGEERTGIRLLVEVRSSPSMEMSMKDGTHTMSMPPGATYPREIAIALMAWLIAPAPIACTSTRP